jgi:hypothetical protein
MLVLLAACAAREDALVRFDPTIGAGIEPEMIAEEGRATTRSCTCSHPTEAASRRGFRGPSEALSAGLRRSEVVVGSGHELIAAIAIRSTE